MKAEINIESSVIALDPAHVLALALVAWQALFTVATQRQIFLKLTLLPSTTFPPKL
jgi:hypothetical protein